jgi:predicted TPR repeat methyltransferase
MNREYRAYKRLFRFFQIVLFPIFRLKCIGRENIPAGPAVLCANHSSNFDPIMISLAIGIEHHYPENCDLIVCRNVMIYFTEEAKSLMYHKFRAALNNNGVLFVGSTEQIILPQRYKMEPVKTFFYKKSGQV